jgi:KipI family sensor histidine kinase inhibitor
MAEILAASDCSLLVRFGEQATAANRQAVLSLLRAWEEHPAPGFRSISPAAASVLFRFDPLRWTHSAAEAQIRQWLRFVSQDEPQVRTVHIPVCYGGEFGPDLPRVAHAAGLTEQEVIALHCGREYRALFLGFAPGFAYLGEVEERIAMPRRDRPRLRVEAGSVGIAARQTAVYPLAMPGGWNLIGRTPLPMLFPEGARLTRIEPGDAVRFHPVTRDEFEHLRDAPTEMLPRGEEA